MIMSFHSFVTRAVSSANWPIVQVLLVNLQIEAAALDRNGGGRSEPDARMICVFS